MISVVSFKGFLGFRVSGPLADGVPAWDWYTSNPLLPLTKCTEHLYITLDPMSDKICLDHNLGLSDKNYVLDV